MYVDIEVIEFCDTDMEKSWNFVMKILWQPWFDTDTDFMTKILCIHMMFIYLQVRGINFLNVYDLPSGTMKQQEFGDYEYAGQVLDSTMGDAMLDGGEVVLRGDISISREDGEKVCTLWWLKLASHS